MKHYIIAKCTDSVSDITGFVKKAEAHFQAITEVEGVYAVRVVEGIREGANRFHIMIEIDMDRSALKAYDESDCHHEWKEKFGPYLEKKTIFDYE